MGGGARHERRPRRHGGHAGGNPAGGIRRRLAAAPGAAGGGRAAHPAGIGGGDDRSAAAAVPRPDALRRRRAGAVAGQPGRAREPASQAGGGQDRRGPLGAGWANAALPAPSGRPRPTPRHPRALTRYRRRQTGGQNQPVCRLFGQPGYLGFRGRQRQPRVAPGVAAAAGDGQREIPLRARGPGRRVGVSHFFAGQPAAVLPERPRRPTRDLLHAPGPPGGEDRPETDRAPALYARRHGRAAGACAIARRRRPWASKGSR